MEDKHSLSIMDFIKCLEKTNNTINDYQILNLSFEDWNEILEKSSKTLNYILRIYNTAQLYAFKKFLRGISSQINVNNPLTPENEQKLARYLSKEKNVSFIYNTVRKSLTANSLQCTEILAIIVGKILQSRFIITEETIAIIDALYTINDYDLENFYKIYKVMNENNLRKIRLDKLYSLISKENIHISIRKLTNLQLFFQDIITIHQGMRFGGDEKDPLNTIMNDDEKFLLLNHISDILFDLLNEIERETLF